MTTTADKPETKEERKMEYPKILAGKTALVSGVANKRSIAWGIAQALSAAGARVAFSYQGERLKDGVAQLANELEGSILVDCDVTSDEEVTKAFKEIGEQFGGKLDIMVHSIAFAPKETLQGGYVDTQREHFKMAQDISAYSLAAMSNAARPLMQAAGGGSIITLSYLGAEKVVPNYNMMGIAKASLEANVKYMAASLGPEGTRVNAISAGPIRTLAASGIKSFRKMLSETEKQTPIRRNVTIDEVGNAAAFMCSDLASGISGEILFVDGGFNTTGMGPLEKD